MVTGRKLICRYIQKTDGKENANREGGKALGFEKWEREGRKLDCLMFIQGEKREAIAFLGISQRRLPGKVPNYPGSCLPTPKDFLPAALLN